MQARRLDAKTLALSSFFLQPLPLRSLFFLNNLEMFNMNESQPSRQDPASLPEETFVHSLSFLSPFSLATSSSISRAWRRPILSNPTLHTEIDLSRMGKSTTIPQFIDTFRRLSSLGNHQIRTLHLNLTCFSLHVSDEHIGSVGGAIFTRRMRFFQLNQIIKGCQDTLREIKFTVDQDQEDEWHVKDEGAVEELIYQLFSFVDRFEPEKVKYSNLQSIEIDTPVLRLKAQAPQGDPEDDVDEEGIFEDFPRLLLAMKKVVGNGDFTVHEDRTENGLYLQQL